MDEEKKKFVKFKQEQKAKSKSNELFNSYIEDSKNIEDKIAVVKLKHKVDKSLFVSSLKKLMRKK